MYMCVHACVRACVCELVFSSSSFSHTEALCLLSESGSVQWLLQCYWWKHAISVV